MKMHEDNWFVMFVAQWVNILQCCVEAICTSMLKYKEKGYYTCYLMYFIACFSILPVKQIV